MKLYNTLTKQVEEFYPINDDFVGMYVCGPTVYDSPHIGNARPAVVFDVLYRLLKNQYKKVIYVRNITDVDDKIYKTAKNKNISISYLTEKTISQYHSDISALNVLPVDIEPRVTFHINDIIEFIKNIIDNGFAYCINKHVYFSVDSFKQYGKLSKIDNLLNGSRVEISEYKKNPADFVLWKPDDELGWDSPWGKGRPGWHIECSAMSNKYLGKQFDIHAGGIDLVFPHHENEIAQSYAANNCLMANYWLHNGHVLVNGTKMSKSLGNFFTVNELLQEFDGEVIRLALLMTHYRHPFDFNKNLLMQAKSILDKWYSLIRNVNIRKTNYVDKDVLNCLLNDLNTPQAITLLSKKANLVNNEFENFVNTCQTLLGILLKSPSEWFQNTNIDINWIESQIDLRNKLKKCKNFTEADKIRNNLKQLGIDLEDTPSGTIWHI